MGLTGQFPLVAEVRGGRELSEWLFHFRPPNDMTHTRARAWKHANRHIHTHTHHHSARNTWTHRVEERVRETPTRAGIGDKFCRNRRQIFLQRVQEYETNFQTESAGIGDRFLQEQRDRECRNRRQIFFSIVSQCARVDA